MLPPPCFLQVKVPKLQDAEGFSVSSNRSTEVPVHFVLLRPFHMFVESPNEISYRFSSHFLTFQECNKLQTDTRLCRVPAGHVSHNALRLVACALNKPLSKTFFSCQSSRPGIPLGLGYICVTVRSCQERFDSTLSAPLKPLAWRNLVTKQINRLQRRESRRMFRLTCPDSSVLLLSITVQAERIIIRKIISLASQKISKCC